MSPSPNPHSHHKLFSISNLGNNFLDFPLPFPLQPKNKSASKKNKERKKDCNVFESVTFYYGCAMMSDLLVTFMGVVLKDKNLK